MFLDIRFPTRVALGAVGGPGFMTNIAIMANGAESRNQEWEFERGEWEVSQAAKLPIEYKPLQAFFRVVRGRANSWRFKDWTDFEAEAGEGLFVNSEIGSPPSGKQMIKRYTFGSYTYDRIITKPVNGTITLSGGGSLDYDTGVVAGGAPTAWRGEFDCQCRFETDRMQREFVNRHPTDGIIITWASIPIVEVRYEE